MHAASHNKVLPQYCVLLYESICDDNHQAFKEYSDGITFDDSQPYGTMLLNLVATSPRGKYQNTKNFIKDLINMGATPNKTHQVLVSTMQQKTVGQKVVIQGSTGFHTVHLPLENAILAGNIDAVEALCQNGANVMQTSVSLTSWWQRWFVESEKPSDHALTYFNADESEAYAMQCKATKDELYKILNILEHHEQNVPTWKDKICPIQ